MDPSWTVYLLKYLFTSELRLLGRFTMCVAQTTTASRMLFGVIRHFVPQKFKKIGKFQFD